MSLTRLWPVLFLCLLPLTCYAEDKALSKEQGALLQDRVAWNKASAKDQDAIIKAVSTLLGAEYKWLSTETYSCDGISHRIAIFQHVKSGLQMNLIPGGSYQMGTDEKSSIDEKPKHKATIQPMLIGRFEVRQSIFDKIGGYDARKWRGEDLPVERVSWTAAKKWLKRAGGGLRLPSESEWEYACRGGSDEAFFWGPKANKEYAWYRSNCQKTMKVTLHEKAKKWNSFGLIDILGNVSEWVEDDYIRDYSEGPYDHKPRYSKRANKKVIRGGCWLYPPKNTLRSYDRNYYRAAGQDYILGFRAARGLN